MQPMQRMPPVCKERLQEATSAFGTLGKPCNYSAGAALRGTCLRWF